ncbi:MAG: Hpt domain-containing protein, partial [Casimicrobiaceae bacterium]
ITVAEREFRGWIDTLAHTRRVTLDPMPLHAAIAAVMAELPATGSTPATSVASASGDSAPPLQRAPVDAVAARVQADDPFDLPELGATPATAPHIVVRDFAPLADAGADTPHPLPSLKLVADNTQLAPAAAPAWDAAGPGGVATDDIEANFDKDLSAHLDRDVTKREDDFDITLMPIEDAAASYDFDAAARVGFDFDAAANAGFEDAEVTPIAPVAPTGNRITPIDLQPDIDRLPPADGGVDVDYGVIGADGSALDAVQVDDAGVQSEPHAGMGLDEGEVIIGDVTLSSTLFRILTDEADEHVATLQHELTLLQFDSARVPSATMVRASHTLCGIHRTGGFPRVASTAKALEQVLLSLAERTPPMPSLALPVIARAVACLADLVGRIKARAPFVASEEREAADSAAELEMLRQDTSLTGADAESHAAGVAERDEASGEAGASPQALPGTPSSAAAAPPAAIAAQPASIAAVAPSIARKEQPQISVADVRDVIDTDVLAIFLEEAAELFPQAGDELRRWRRDPAIDGAALLLRTLHTFKGSARMAGAMRLGELAHQMESRLVEGEMPAEVTPALFEALDTDLDHMAYVIDRLRAGEANSPLPWIVVEDAAAAEPADDEQDTDLASDGVVVPISAAAGGSAVARPLPPRAEALEPEAGARSMLRVRADTVDRLVNEAGEVAIARARVEGELRMLKANLLELTGSVIRLRSQVREIEIQAESQIQSRMGSLQEDDEGFDPLEFDRYTRFQELTRSLAEGVNDVSTVQQSLLKNLDDADAALVAQARMSREVSQQLFAIRTVPFGSVSERLYRILRATARELDKRVNLEILGAQVELDR